MRMPPPTTSRPQIAGAGNFIFQIKFKFYGDERLNCLSRKCQSFVVKLYSRGGLGLCLCVCYSAIFTKTNRISRKGLKYWVVDDTRKLYFTLFKMNSFHRIFNNSTVGAQKPKWISPRSQLAICSGLVSIQVRPDLVVTFLYRIKASRESGAVGPDIEITQTNCSLPVINVSEEWAVMTGGLCKRILMICVRLSELLSGWWWSLLGPWSDICTTRELTPGTVQSNNVPQTQLNTPVLWRPAVSPPSPSSPPSSTTWSSSSSARSTPSRPGRFHQTSMKQNTLGLPCTPPA